MNIYEIIPGVLYQSGLVDSWVPLDERHIKVVVNMTNDPDAIALSRGHGPYMRAPIIDGPLPYQGILDSVVTFVVTHVRHGYATLVHCAYGRGRSGLINALVLRELENITGAEAVARIRSIVPGALTNQEFVDYLEALDKPRPDLV